jgi:hypothetical protein
MDELDRHLTSFLLCRRRGTSERGAARDQLTRLDGSGSLSPGSDEPAVGSKVTSRGRRRRAAAGGPPDFAAIAAVMRRHGLTPAA